MRDRRHESPATTSGEAAAFRLIGKISLRRPPLLTC